MEKFKKLYFCLIIDINKNENYFCANLFSLSIMSGSLFRFCSAACLRASINDGSQPW